MCIPLMDTSIGIGLVLLPLLHMPSVLANAPLSQKKLGGNIRSSFQIIIGISDSNLIIAYVLSTVDVRSLKNKLSSVNSCHTVDGSISRNAIGINLCIKFC